MTSFEPFFRLFCGHLRQRGPIVSHVLFGSACELWAVAEACACLNVASPAVLPPGTCMVNEHRKRDAVLWEQDGAGHRILMAVEAKAIYPNKDLCEALRTLKDQLCRKPHVDEVPQMPRYGLVLAVWDSYYQSQKCPDSKQFFAFAAKMMREVFIADAYRPGFADMLEVVLPQCAVVRGKSTRSVALAAGFIQCLSRVPEDLPDQER